MTSKLLVFFMKSEYHLYRDAAWLEPRTAYIHIPFCAHHCGYCDFAVTVGQDILISPYLAALDQELRNLGNHLPIESAFIGGGTPTYLSAGQLDQFLGSFHRTFDLAPQGEFTIEATPESINEEKCQILKTHRINRISLGIQTFQEHLLQQLDRIHEACQIPNAIELVQKYDMALSLDLIFAAPQATRADWESDLAQAISYQPNHISTYGLTYEKGTPIWKQRERGLLLTVEEELEREMYSLSMTQLPKSGYTHYEVSNFAQQNHECQHNHRYWANEAYYGCGVGAAGYVRGERNLNVRNTKVYIEKVSKGDSPKFQSESMIGRDYAFETFAIQLRRAIGIHHQQFEIQTGFAFPNLVADRLPKLIEEGLLDHSATQTALTEKGFFVADGIIEFLLQAQ